MTQGRQERPGFAEAPSSDPLLVALAHAGAAVLIEDDSRRYIWTHNTPRAWSTESVVGKVDADFLPADAVNLLSGAKVEILAGGSPRRIELEIRSGDGLFWYEVWLDAYTNSAGMRGILTTALETTEQRQREQTLRTLLREVSHRSKNLLAIIQSIASQTGRHADSISEFLTRFRGRLQSLSSSQDLVTSSNWRGADLVQLVNDQVARYCADPTANLRLAGENPYLTPNAALHVGLALHELAVNSVSYGALSQPDGGVDISVRSLDGGEMELEWRERLRGLGSRPDRGRFGKIALERIVPASLDSKAMLVIDSDELVYRLVLPTDSFHLSPP